MNPKIYLAGPDIFYPNADQVGKVMKDACRKHNLEGLFPLDEQITFCEEESGPEKATKVYKADIGLLEEADAVVANLTPFRGVSADPGTCFEMGYAVAKRKPVWAYSKDHRIYKNRATAMGYDNDGFKLEDFYLPDNLMILVPAGNTVFSSLETALRDISEYFKVSKENEKWLIQILGCLTM